MTAIIPTAGDGGLTPRQSAQLARAERSAELDLYRHRLGIAVKTERDRMDLQAIGDVITTATEEELNFLDYGMAMANGSATKRELVARKANMMSAINNTLITRRYGR